MIRQTCTIIVSLFIVTASLYDVAYAGGGQHSSKHKRHYPNLRHKYPNHTNTPSLGENELALFGPKEFERDYRKPKTETHNFTVDELDAFLNFSLRLTNGGDFSTYIKDCKNENKPVLRIKCEWHNILARLADKKSQASNVKIVLNNVQLVSDNNFNKHTESLEVPIPQNLLQINNTIKVTVDGKPKSFITLMVVGLVDDDVPVNLPPVAQISANPTSGIAPLLVLLDGSASTDPENSQLTYNWNFGDGQSAQGAQVSHIFQNVGSYQVSLTVTDDQGATHVAQIQINTDNPPTVPEPETIAPPLISTQQTPMALSVSFLYSGPNPVQLGVTAGAIEERRTAVIRGRVMDQNSQPIQGVEVQVLRHPELGHTYTRQDGEYDIVVNGGGQITLVYERNGYLPVQRQIQTVYQQYFPAPLVVMTSLDPVVTKIEMNSSTAQIARGSVVTDASGARQATVQLPAATTAELIFSNGSRQNINQLSLRATEYTVGPNGPKAMPAPLPHTSAYTYAVEFSADEALVSGAEHIEFSQPVSIYVDNFLGFSVGGVVPVGVYDRQKDVWVPEPNGRVIRVDSIVNNQAVLVVSTSGQPATQSELNQLGITPSELVELAQLYQAGQTFWRVRTTRFSPKDFNWFEDNVGDNAPEPVLPPPEIVDDIPSEGPTNQCGSIVQVETQTLSEVVPLTGITSNLFYTSRHALGRAAKRTLKIPITSNTPPAGLQRIDLTVQTAGQIFTKSFINPTANQVETYTWDGMDAYGRLVQSDVVSEITIRYVYGGVYFESLNTTDENIFAFTGTGLTATAIPSRGEVVYEKTYTQHLGVSRYIQDQAISGWTLSEHHFYNPMTRILYTGSGEEREATDVGRIVTTVAGTGVPSYSGDGGLAKTAGLRVPNSVTVLRDGSLVISDAFNFRIRKVSPNGIITTIAGFGAPGFSGDGGPATAAQISQVGRVSEAPDGTLYFEGSDHRIRKISPNGIISTVAGNGVAGLSGDGGPATAAQINTPRGVVVGNDGSVYFGDASNNRIRRIGTDGIIRTFAGTGVQGFSGDNGPAIQAQFNAPLLLSIGNQGELYVADRNNNRIRQIDRAGIVTTVAGNGTADSNGDSGLATAASLFFPFGITTDRDGSFYISESGGKVRWVSPDGIITTLVGLTLQGFNGDQLANQTQITLAGSVAIGPDSEIYFTDINNHRVRKITKAYPSLGASEYAITSTSGSEVYIFDTFGTHLRTRHARTGAIKRQFEYTNGRLTAMVDGDGNRTEITRNANGQPTQITSPYGQVTTLATNSDGFLTSITNPNNETYALTYQSGGLLSSFQNPRGATSTFTYDGLGKLTRDTNALGNFFELVENALTNEVHLTTNEGRTTQTAYQKSYTRTDQTHTNAAGLVTETTKPKDGQLVTTYPTSTEINTTRRTDPRFSSLLYPSQSSERTPSGLTRTVQTNKAVTLPNVNDLFNFTENTTTQINSRIYTTNYNSSTRESIITSPEGRQTLRRMDAQERTTATAQAGIEPINYVYDSRGRLSQIQQGPRIATTTYDANGFAASSTDALNRTTTYFRDNTGRVLTQTLPDGRAINYTYDAAGNRTSITPPSKPTHNFIFDALNMIESYLPPALQSQPVNTIYEYNTDKDLTRIIRPNGKVIDYVYDQAGRRSTAQTSIGNYTYGYSPTTGKLITESSPDGVTTNYTYDGDLMQFISQSGQASGALNFTYNSDFNISSSQVNNLQNINFIYNSDNLLSLAGSLNINYSPQNTLVTGTSLNSITQNISYNQFGEVIDDRYTRQSTPLYSLTLTRDNLGRITEKSENLNGAAINSTYQYDLAGRLTNVNRNGDQRLYQYDPNGNRTSATINGQTEVGTYDDQDRLLSYASNVYTYDMNGDLTSKVNSTGTTTYNYDVMGNLQAVQLPSGQLIEYIIDARNRRVGKNIDSIRQQQFIYQNQLQIAAELDANGLIVSRFIYATKPNVPDYMIRNGLTYRLITDQVGSVRAVVDAGTGFVMQEIIYDEFGRVLADTNPGFQPFGFAGGLYDSLTGLVRFGARDYEPNTGRWTTKDPIGFDGGDSNLFGYVLQDPVNLVDPSGETSTTFPITFPIEIVIGNPIAGIIIGICTIIPGDSPKPEAPKENQRAICKKAWEAAIAGCNRIPNDELRLTCQQKAHDELNRCLSGM